MHITELTTPYVKRKIIEYGSGRNYNTPVRHWHEMQQITGPLYKGRAPFPAYLDNLKQDMENSRVVGLADIAFVKQFDEAMAQRMSIYREGRLEQRERIRQKQKSKRLAKKAADDKKRRNAGFPFVTKTKGRENRYQMVCGMFAHELGHVLYADFLTPQTQANYMDMGRWYPEPPALRTSADFANEKALWAYTKADPKNLVAVKTVSHHIANVLEDGSCHVFESILEVMLSYVKFWQIKYGDEPLSDERIQTTFDLITELDRAVTEHDSKVRLNLLNLILVRCWEPRCYAR